MGKQSYSLRAVLVVLKLLVLCQSVLSQTATNTTRSSPDCSSVHRACTSCYLRREWSTRRTELVCSACAAGWRLRRDRQLKTCDCIPGTTLNGTDPGSAWCVPCPAGLYCTGGSARNPLARPTACVEGLETKSPGAKSAAQCFTNEGYGRNSVVLPNGTVTVTVFKCPRGTYNVGGNMFGCQQCGNGLTTVNEGSSSIDDCVAPPGRYMDTGVGRICPKGTYTEDFNKLPFCISCNTGFTTETEGSNSSASCDRVLPGYFMVNSTYAEECPAGSYQDQEGTIVDCNACPFGYMTQSGGSGGNAECLAPPGWELKEGAARITECEIGFYKRGWNKNPCESCGKGLTTEYTGSVSVEECRVKPGWGIVSLNPLESEKCDNNRYGDPELRPVAADSRCVSCPTNMYTMDYLKGIQTAGGYTSELDCYVLPGWGYERGGIVEMCQLGLYNAGYNREACQYCPAAYITIETGADTPDLCVVQDGWAVDTSTGLPSPCDAGTWSSGGTQENPGGTCVPCPIGFTTQRDESYSPDDCNVCAAGYGGPNCTICGYNTYSLDGQKDCAPCATGTVSGRKATDNTHCVPAMFDANNDYLPLSDPSHWTDDAASLSSASCELSCNTNPLCATFRFLIGQADSPGTAKCQLLLEAPTGEQVVGFKASKGSDYALYRVPGSLQIGVLVADVGAKTPEQCMDMCTGIGACEVVSLVASDLPHTVGPCKLYGSVLDADWVGMYHIQGNRLYSDSMIA